MMESDLVLRGISLGQKPKEGLFWALLRFLPATAMPITLRR